MSNRSDPSSTNAKSAEQTRVENEAGGQLLLEEIRTTATQQLSQIDKIDDIAVQTVQIAFLLLGVLGGGTQFGSFPDLGLLGGLGMASLVGSLVAALFRPRNDETLYWTSSRRREYRLRGTAARRRCLPRSYRAVREGNGEKPTTTLLEYFHPKRFPCHACDCSRPRGPGTLLLIRRTSFGDLIPDEHLLSGRQLV